MNGNFRQSQKEGKWKTPLTMVNCCFTVIGKTEIEGSKINVVIKAWLPYKAVMSVVMVGYTGP